MNAKRLRYRGDEPAPDIVFELERQTIHVFQTPTKPALDALVNQLNNECPTHKYNTYVITGTEENVAETYQKLKSRVQTQFITKSTGPAPLLSLPPPPTTERLFTLAELRELIW